MPTYIERDYSRFKEIVRGTIRKNLKDYITRGEMIGRQGKDSVRVPLPQIEIPKFKFGGKGDGGTGQGEGDVGDGVGKDGQKGSGSGKAGSDPGEHTVETDVTYQELAEILGEELKLPLIQPKGMDKVNAPHYKYSSVRKTGPESLKHFKRTFKQALKRQAASGSYNFDNPIIVPIKEDKIFRFFKQVPQPQYNAVIIYIMDVSGSMGEEQKEIVRLEAFWIDTWIKYNYRGVDRRYIIHDAKAREVDEETFYHTKESGGTLISSAYELALKILDEEYPLTDWNVYLFQFSDGDNWSADDTKKCIAMLQEQILKRVNMVGYGQVKSFFGSGQYLNDLRDGIKDADNLVLSDIPSKEAILDSIKTFLGQGK